MATMDDIARHLGVTKGTVSKALSGAADVSGTMRKSVLEAAVELGYSRIPRTGASRRVCIFIQNMDWEKPEDFGWEIVTGFRKLAEPAGYQVDIVPLTEPLQKASPYDEYMLLHGYQGALFLGLTLLDPWMKDFQTCSTPAVLYDSCVKSNPAVTQVGIDNDEGMDMAVTRLLELGHRKIGYLSSALGAYIYQARYASFFQALRKKRTARPAGAGRLRLPAGGVRGKTLPPAAGPGLHGHHLLPRPAGPYGADPLPGAGDRRPPAAERHRV